MGAHSYTLVAPRRLARRVLAKTRAGEEVRGARREARGVERVLGIGGVFFAAADAELGRWYADHLGIPAPGGSSDDEVWTQQAGPTVFAPFGDEHRDSPHLGPSGWGINFRVGDLDAMVAQLSSTPRRPASTRPLRSTSTCSRRSCLATRANPWCR